MPALFDDTVIVDDPEPPDVNVTVFGLAELVSPGGLDVTATLTVPLNPFRLFS